MAAIAAKPGPVALKSGNIAAEWAHFKQKFEIFLVASQQEKAPSAVKWALLLGEAGNDALEVYNSFKDKLMETKEVTAEDGTVTTVKEDYSQSYERVLMEFDAYAAEKKSLTGCRELFNGRNQKGGEAFANWLTDLKNLIKHCEYGAIEDSVLKDRIVWGVHDKRLKETLRSKPNLSLQEVVDVCKAIESTVKPTGGLGEEAQVDALRLYNSQPLRGGKQFRSRGGGKAGRGGDHSRGHGSKPYNRGGGGQRRIRTSSSARGRGRQHGQYRNSAEEYKCRKCGKWHKAFSCPAHGKECLACGGANHFAAVCRNGAPLQANASKHNPTVKTIETVDMEGKSKESKS